MDKLEAGTVRWWRAQYDGICHSHMLLHKEVAELTRKVEAYHQRMRDQQNQIDELHSMLGEHHAASVETAGRLDRVVGRLREKFGSSNGEHDNG